MLRFYISLFFLFVISIGYSKTQNNDTIEKFGIRAGVDLNKIIKSATSEDYKGLSINADIRIKESLYVFSELGNEEKKINTYYLNSNIKGTYLKVGLNFKLNNDLRSANIVYSGFNIGYSNFEQTINNFTIYNTNSSTWGEATSYDSIALSKLNALWFEFVFGLKTEIFNNLFLGFELQLKSVVKQKIKNDISNFYIPGFNRTYDSSKLGAGFNYTISYLITVVKK